MRRLLLLVACQSVATTSAVDLSSSATRDLSAPADLAMALGTLVFQCAGIAGGVCVMDADGANRQTLLASGRAPERNAAGDILFHDDSYTVQLLRGDTVTPLGAGAFARWSP